MSILKRVRKDGKGSCYYCAYLKNGVCQKLDIPVYLDNYCARYSTIK